MLNITQQQRAAILRAAADAAAMPATNPATYDAVDLASDTSNYWWSGGRMDNRACACALRLIHMCLRRA